MTAGAGPRARAQLDGSRARCAFLWRELSDEIDCLCDNLERERARAAEFEQRLVEPEHPAVPAMELLRQLASGEGGRRTGDLMRRGWIRVEVTDEGRAALAEWDRR